MDQGTASRVPGRGRQCTAQVGESADAQWTKTPRPKRGFSERRGRKAAVAKTLQLEELPGLAKRTKKSNTPRRPLLASGTRSVREYASVRDQKRGPLPVSPSQLVLVGLPKLESRLLTALINFCYPSNRAFSSLLSKKDRTRTSTSWSCSTSSVAMRTSSSFRAPSATQTTSSSETW